MWRLLTRMWLFGPRDVHGSRLTALGPGVLMCCTVAMAAAYASVVQGGPQMLYALAFGTVFHFQSHHPRTEPGVSLCMRGVLRMGIALLGVRLTVEQISGLGWAAVVITMAAVATTVLCGVVLARLLRLSTAVGLLAGGACAICGAAAALAIAAALPQHPDKHRNTLAVVVMAMLCSTVATLLYPLLARRLGLSDLEAGLFIGATLHDVAQVVVAGYSLGHTTGDVATVIKLLRVSLLTVVVLAISIGTSSSAERGKRGGHPFARLIPPIPWFLWLFIAMVVLHSAGAMSDQLQRTLVGTSTACLMVGVTGLGMNTSFAGLTSVGWRPVFLMIACSTWIAAFVLSAIAASRHL